MSDIFDAYSREIHLHHFFGDAIHIVSRHRPWFNALTNKYRLHPAVREAYIKHGMPRNWQTLLLEWPHQSETDPNRLAYTPSERYGEDDRQLITSIGKYLNRHFDLPDHVIRDLVARFTSGDCTFKFLNTTEGMVDAVQRGPYSCMCWRERDLVRCSDGERRHPYEVYAPEYGWHMAVRLQGDDVVGRALCNKDGDDKLYWVRSYKKDPNGGYSYADEFLEAWLKSQGYEKRSEWEEGTRMAYHPTSDEFLAPYIDGDERHVDVCRGADGVGYLVIDSNGEFECDETGGAPAGSDNETCEDCDERYNEDDMTTVGAWEDRRVCNGCLDNYRYAYTRRGYQCYIHEDNVAWVESQDEYYDTDYLSDNNIVELIDGEYEHIDNAVEIDGDWYPSDDDRIVFDEYHERHDLIDNCEETEDNGWVRESETWVCAESGKRYSDAVDYVEIDGDKYYPDHVPATNDETNEE